MKKLGRTMKVLVSWASRNKSRLQILYSCEDLMVGLQCLIIKNKRIINSDTLKV
jgi:hypothetical protein